ncbi:serine/arginine-rich SC35-like splicing factor SCL33 [Selaginella moellendorffii]|uniref:serine/arginine-rich SC35-like splicing factor SCL33 n=1 Tax=Selaginella moellendorffii TaxID=88036 RepID=UPI000D1C58D9|nr:serine/arginine-rich SC35-like splicing factor SCL33 [Selaginella moellendorffii]|eukprot:XP_024535223.1 serine/arginine-rich SC35-like splicing factor SCL33 [Selaginella moellendorffii]
MNPEDAARAKHHMDRQVLGGREITVVFAEENRKKPSEMRMKSRVSGWGSRYGGGGYYRHSPRRFRSRSRSYSPGRRYRSSRYDSDRHGRSRYSSPSPARYRSPRHSPSESWSSPRGRRADSRSASPEKNGRKKSSSRSPSREPRRAAASPAATARD